MQPQPTSSPSKTPERGKAKKLLEQACTELVERVSDAIRIKHYSSRTEKTYIDWIRRYILFHNKRHPKDMGAEEIQAFIAHLANQKQLAASTQNQALSAVIFLYRFVLKIDITLPSDIIRARRSETLPVVLTHPEAMSVINKMTGVSQLMTKLLYGSGLRLMECMRLRVKDIDFGDHQTCAELVEVSSSAMAKAKKTAPPCYLMR
ncbi:MAG: phage integrase N-terminal SAM-like domain-containing protein [Anaerolineales bacterium]|nr:phage integrase N-terminal SAM-like domain-containing protein [Anaerolineales bacterium]